MLSYHNDPAIKEFYLRRVRAHRAADELVRGIYWEEGRGCAVGCTLHSNHHHDYEKLLGIPEDIAQLEDDIFERLPLDQALDWPETFLEAIPVGADLRGIPMQVALWALDRDDLPPDALQAHVRDHAARFLADYDYRPSQKDDIILRELLKTPEHDYTPAYYIAHHFLVPKRLCAFASVLSLTPSHEGERDAIYETLALYLLQLLRTAPGPQQPAPLPLAPSVKGRDYAHVS